MESVSCGSLLFFSLSAAVGSVWKLSCDRLHLLEESVPMVQHFHEHNAEIGTWLEEISNEVTSLSSTYDTPEQIRKQQDALKVRDGKILPLS